MMNELEMIETGASLFVRGAALLLGCWIASLAIRRSSGRVCSRLWQSGLVGVVALSALVCLPPIWSVDLSRPKDESQSKEIPISPVDVELESEATVVATSLPSKAASVPQPTEIEPPAVTMTTAENPVVRTELPQKSAVASTLVPTNQAGITRWAFIIWVVGAAVVLLRWGMAIMRLRRFMRQASPADESWTEFLEKCRQELGIRRPVRIVMHPELAAPCISGVIRPTVAVPAGSADWSETKKKAILLHELSHLLGHDLIFQWVSVIAKAVHWVNPLVWVGGRALRDAAERAADELVIRHGVEPTDYADILYQFAVPQSPRRIADFGLCMAERESKMKLRIERLLSLRKVAVAEHPVASLALPTVFLSGALVLGSTAIGQDTTAKSSGNTGSSLAVQAGNPQVSGAIMIEDKLRTLIVPEMNLEDVPFEDAIVWFRQQSMELDEKREPAGSGINFIVRANDRKEALISIRLKSIPMWDALQYVSEMANVDIHVEPFAVMLLPPAEDREIRSKTFMIDEKIFAEELERSGAANALIWLESCGVYFREGSGALFVPNPARILARNNRWNLKIADKIIRSVSGNSSADASAIEINRVKLREIILPEIMFSETSIDEVLDFIQMQSAEKDTITEGDGVKGVQLVNLATNESPITLSLRSVPASVCVRAVADLAGLEFSVEPHAIVLRPKYKSDLQLRTFRVPLSVADSLMESALASLEAGSARDDNPFADGETATTYSGGELWGQILESYGIPETDGSMSFWNPRAGELIVARHPADMKDVANLIKQVGGTEL